MLNKAREILQKKVKELSDSSPVDYDFQETELNGENVIELRGCILDDQIVHQRHFNNEKELYCYLEGIFDCKKGVI